jgi:WD40 repeat protein
MPDGRRCVTANNRLVSIWDLATGREACPIFGHNEDIPALAVSPDGRRLLCGSVAQTVRLWDLETAEELSCFIGHEGEVSAVAFSSDGRMALSGGEDRTVRLWGLPE